jgi:hypothetical protein
MSNIKKRDLKDITHKMILEALKSFDVAFDESEISNKDKIYILEMLVKYQDEFAKKITDLNYLELHNINGMVQYAKTHTNKTKS